MMAFIMHSINIGLHVLFYQGTIEETRALIEWRGANEARFTGLRNSSATGWE